jgi:hypothetical protein
MRTLQAGLFPDASNRMGKCFDCGEAGAVLKDGAAGGFLAWGGVCASATRQALATLMTTPKNIDHTRKGIRYDKSPRNEDTARQASGTNGVGTNRGGSSDYSVWSEFFYHRNLRPNCTWRDVVDVLVMAPAVGETPEGVKTTALGKLKLARFKRLNISARN